jgi:hypothetical protein
MPEGAGRVLGAGARGAGLRVRGEREAVGEDHSVFSRGPTPRRPPAQGDYPSPRVTGAYISRSHRGAHRGDPAGLVDLLKGGDVPAFGRVDSDGLGARAGPADPAADEQQPGAKQPGRAPVLHRLEERQVHQADRVVERREDDPLPGSDGRGLGRHLHAGDADRLAVAAAVQARRADHAESVEQRDVEVEHVLADVEAEDLEFGGDPFG